MLKLILFATKQHFLAHMRNPFDFLSNVFGLILNNSFLLYGIYLLAYANGQEDMLEKSRYLATTALILISWGLLNVCAGGLVELGSLIESGEFEGCLATVRSPLLIAAISKSNPVAIGEVLQGVLTLSYLACRGEYALAVNILACSFCLCLSFAGITILSGMLSFFSSKGSQLSHVLVQSVILFSLFPIFATLRGKERFFLYLTPAVLTATLPSQVLYTEDKWMLLWLFLVSFATLFFAIKIFQKGLRFYTIKNYLFLKEQ